MTGTKYKNIAIIPARGGSKRIPKKNIKEFHGKPIIAYSIELALESGLFEKVIVSTDDHEIAEISEKYGAQVPFIRPLSISGDLIGLEAVTRHALDFLKSQGESYDYLCTILATAPFIRMEFFKSAFKKLENSDACMSFAATTMPFPIQRTFKITNEGRCKMFWPENFNKRSQDLEEAYQDAGQFYWYKLFKEPNDIPFGKESIPIVIPRHLVQDIDNIEDWKRAEIIYDLIHNREYENA